MDDIKVFYIDSEKFLPHINNDSLNYFIEEQSFKSEKRKIQYALGRFLIKFVAQKLNIKNSKIVIKNKKPYLEDNELYFSLSHTKNIVLIACWKNNIGADIEFMKERNFEKYFERYHIEPNNNNKNTFYEFWTKYEAEIKLQKKGQSFFSTELIENFMLSICISENMHIKENIKI